MGFNLNREEEEDDSFSALVEDIELQINLHRNNLLNADISVVETCLKVMLTNILDSLESTGHEDLAKGVLPLLSAMVESIIELRGETDYLKGYILEQKMPPPKEIEN
jgi:hypothetical protein